MMIRVEIIRVVLQLCHFFRGIHVLLILSFILIMFEVVTSVHSFCEADFSSTSLSGVLPAVLVDAMNSRILTLFACRSILFSEAFSCTSGSCYSVPSTQVRFSNWNQFSGTEMSLTETPWNWLFCVEKLEFILSSDSVSSSPSSYSAQAAIIAFKSSGA